MAAIGPSAARCGMVATLAAPALDRALPSNRFLLGWALAWAVVGCVVAGGMVALMAGRVDALPALRFGILTAEVVGFASLASTRLVFPLFARLPYLLFLALQVNTDAQAHNIIFSCYVI